MHVMRYFLLKLVKSIWTSDNGTFARLLFDVEMYTKSDCIILEDVKQICTIYVIKARTVFDTDKISC